MFPNMPFANVGYVKDPQQLTLGGFIKAFKQACEYIQDNYHSWDEEYDRVAKTAEGKGPLTEVYPHFDFANASPSRLLTFVSYRGYYEDLAMQVNMDEYKQPTAEEVLSHAENAEGTIFPGNKGGYYKARMSTPLWVADAGRSTGTVVTGVAYSDCAIVILTKLIMSNALISDNYKVLKGENLRE